MTHKCLGFTVYEYEPQEEIHGACFQDDASYDNGCRCKGRKNCEDQRVGRNKEYQNLGHKVQRLPPSEG